MDDDLPRLPASGDVLAGKYRVDRVVGAGGMGIVVAAQHLTLGQTVAVKLLRMEGLDLDRRTEACARFLREGQAAARLTSEHVVRVHDVGTLDDGAPFMVMELLRGSDLATVIDGQSPVPLGLAIEYIVQACDAVGEAHDHGIVHRDLKPSNLFVSRRSDGRPLVKVLDFGISKAMVGADDLLQGNLTSTRSVVGSPYYMSPEQVRDSKRVDARSDIWSLGMILYELLVGEPAFNAETLPGICAAIAADAPPPIRERRPDVPPELEAIVMRCLEKDPAKRFSTVVELVRALAPFIPHTTGVSTADYASKRLEESQATAAKVRRYPADQATVHSGPDSGLRLSERGNGPPASVAEVSASSATLPAVLRSAASQTPASPAPTPLVIPESTLVSRTGNSLRSPEEAAPQGLVIRASTTERTASGRRPLVLVLVAGVGVGVSFWAMKTPPAAPTVAPSELHEPVGPAPRLEAIPAPGTKETAVPEPPLPAPLAVPALSANTPGADPAPSAAAGQRVAAPKPAPAKVAPRPAKRPGPAKAGPSNPSADIRLER